MAGTIDTRVVVNRFTAVGTKVVGHGTATSVLRQADGDTTVTKRAFRLTIRQQHTRRMQSVQQETMCHILFLELDELDLTLLGLGLVVDLNKIQLTITAIPGTTIGNLFCELAGGPPGGSG